MIELSPQFITLLQNYPDLLLRILDIAKRWYEIQKEIPEPVDAEGPQEFVPHEDHELRTEGISPEDLDALHRGYAEAIVKEKAAQYIRGFIAGITILK